MSWGRRFFIFIGAMSDAVEIKAAVA